MDTVQPECSHDNAWSSWVSLNKTRCTLRVKEQWQEYSRWKYFGPWTSSAAIQTFTWKFCRTHMLAASLSPFPALCVLSSGHHCSQRLFYIAKHTTLRSSIRVHFSFTFAVFKSTACVVSDRVKLSPTRKRYVSTLWKFVLNLVEAKIYEITFKFLRKLETMFFFRFFGSVHHISINENTNLMQQY